MLYHSLLDWHHRIFRSSVCTRNATTGHPRGGPGVRRTSLRREVRYHQRTDDDVVTVDLPDVEVPVIEIFLN